MKKMRIACCLLAGLTVLESAVLPVHAGSIIDDYPTGYTYHLKEHPELKNIALNQHTYNGRPAYCLEPDVVAGEGDVYEEVNPEQWTALPAETREIVMLASVFGVGYQDRTNELWYAAAQDYIWAMEGIQVVWEDDEYEDHIDEKVKAAAKEIDDSIKAWQAEPDFYITDTVTNRKVGNDGIVTNAEAGRMYCVEDKTGVITGMKFDQAEGLRVFDENEKELSPSEICPDKFLVRNDNENTAGSLTIKGPAAENKGFNRDELIQEIPVILFGNARDPSAQKHVVTGRLEPREYQIRIETAAEPYRICKTDEKGKGMKGAALSLEKDGKVIDTWTSDGQAHEISLEKGETYEIREIDAPAGYYCKDFTITADAANHHDVVNLINDEKIRYEVLKIDEGGKPVKGARLALYDVTDGSAELVRMNDEKGNPWVTDGKARDISAYLQASHSYCVVEEDVSTEYFLAEDTEFSVSRCAPEGSPVKTVKITDNHIVYRFAKLDENGKPVENAELKIYDLDEDGKEAVGFTTGTLPEIVTTLKRGHHYVLRETVTPQGRYTMEEKEFAVPLRHSAEPITITGIDYNIVYYADKTDETDKPVAGASMEVHDVTDGADRLVSAFITDDKPHLLSNLAAGHQYILRETDAPQGYYRSEDVHFQVPVKGTGEPVHVKAVDHTVGLPIRKVDPEGNRLAGIRLEVIDQESGAVVGSWLTSADADIEIGSLVQADREYILREAEGINGYWQHKDMTFRVPKQYGEAVDLSLVMVDQPMQIQVRKEDEASHPLAGAHITLREKGTDEVLHEWNSGQEPYDISPFVQAGKNYVLNETEIAAGHYKAAEQEFTAGLYPEKDNPVITLTMIDETIHYEITKVNEEGNPVGGVHLKVKDVQTGEMIDEWDTDENAHELTGVLNAGGTYLLEETEWKNGVRQAQDMQFTVPWQGTSQPVRIRMVDETVGLAFLKTDEEGKPLAGAVLAILDMDGKEICSFTSTEDSHGVSRLEDGTEISALLKGGSSYVLHEKESPRGYALTSDLHFTADGSLTRPQLVSMSDPKVPVYLHLIKADASHPEKRLPGAQLAVYRSADHTIARDRDGKNAVVTTDENGEARLLLIYDPDGYYVKEIKAPAGYQLTSEIYEVHLTDEQGFSPEHPAVLSILNDQEVQTGTSGVNPKLLAGAGFLILSISLLLYRRERKE